MKQYDSYKDSGVEWIGKIPSHWESCRFKNFVSLVTTSSNDSCKIGLENIESKTGKFIASDTVFEGNGIAFDVDDIVYGKLRPYLQKVWMASFRGNAVGDFFVFRKKKNSSSRYLLYVMLSDGFTSECNGATLGAKMPRVSSEFILNMPFGLPTLSEQLSIASFLDTQTARIDSIISSREKKIKLLEELRASIILHAVTKGIRKDVKLKDSGIEWIGKMPNHWIMRKIKYCFAIYAGATPKTEVGKFWDGDINWITPADYKTSDKYVSKGQRTISEAGYNSCNTQLVPKGSLIFSKRAPIGTVAISKVPLCTNQGCLSCVPKTGNVLFFYYCASVSADYFSIFGSGTTFKEISSYSFANIKMPFPPIAEQDEIVRYLEYETSRIDISISKARREIGLLKEYRASLITEVVTGKKRVIL